MSCANGCELAYYAKDREMCECNCGVGNSAGCDWKHPDIAGTFEMCHSCQEGCDGSTDTNECNVGCNEAEGLSGFYNDVRDETQIDVCRGETKPRDGDDCAIDPYDGMLSPTFIANIAQGKHFSRSAVFDDEEFLFISGNGNYLNNPRGIICVDGETTPRSQIELFDDGVGGDGKALDFVYTRGCLSICPGVLDTHNVQEECIGCGAGGQHLLGILHHSIRGTVPIENVLDQSPQISGCEAMYATSHGFFAVCEEMFPKFPKVGAWDVQAPTNCIPCRKMWERFGNAFDFFAFRGLTALTDAGDNYIRVIDSVKGIGFDNENGPLDQWAFGSRLRCDAFTFDRIQGNLWGQYPSGYIHEVAHWLGFDLPKLPAYLSEDGAHLPSACTLHGPLQSPVWCWDEGYPCAVELEGNNDAVFLEPNPRESDGTITFRYESVQQEKYAENPKLLLYMMGLISAEEASDEVFYCLIDGTVDDSDQQRITAEYSSFTVWDLIEYQGQREPVLKPLYHSVDNDLRIGQITVSAKVPSEAEMAWWTVWNRHFEDDMDLNVNPSRDTWGWGKGGWHTGFPSFKYSTQGLMVARSKLPGISCHTDEAVAFESETCNSPDDTPIDPVCEGEVSPCAADTKSKCKASSECKWGAKKIKTCVPKTEFDHNCSQYSTKELCSESVCVWKNKKSICAHKCDVVQKQCKKRAVSNEKICKKKKEANPCQGCRVKNEC